MRFTALGDHPAVDGHERGEPAQHAVPQRSVDDALFQRGVTGDGVAVLQVADVRPGPLRGDGRRVVAPTAHGDGPRRPVGAGLLVGVAQALGG